MPRIYGSDSNPYDFCRYCFPRSEAQAHLLYGDIGDGPDGRGNCFSYDDEHPSYEEMDYSCHVCEEKLIDKRDW